MKLIYVFCRNKVLKILAFLCGGKNRELEKTLKQVGKYRVLILSGQFELSLTAHLIHTCRTWLSDLPTLKILEGSCHVCSH